MTAFTSHGLWSSSATAWRDIGKGFQGVSIVRIGSTCLLSGTIEINSQNSNRQFMIGKIPSSADNKMLAFCRPSCSQSFNSGGMRIVIEPDGSIICLRHICQDITCQKLAASSYYGPSYVGMGSMLYVPSALSSTHSLVPVKPFRLSHIDSVPAVHPVQANGGQMCVLSGTLVVTATDTELKGQYLATTLTTTCRPLQAVRFPANLQAEQAEKGTTIKRMVERWRTPDQVEILPNGKIYLSISASKPIAVGCSAQLNFGGLVFKAVAQLSIRRLNLGSAAESLCFSRWHTRAEARRACEFGLSFSQNSTKAVKRDTKNGGNDGQVGEGGSSDGDGDGDGKLLRVISTLLRVNISIAEKADKAAKESNIKKSSGKGEPLQ